MNKDPAIDAAELSNQGEGPPNTFRLSDDKN